MRKLSLILVAFLLALVAPSPPARAQELRDVATWSGLYNELEMSVTVISVGRAITEAQRASDPWWSWGNTTTDAYLFSFNRPDEVDLAIVFSNEAARPVATIYVPQNEAQRRGFQIAAGRIVLPPNTHPTARIQPRHGTWLIDGQPNFDLSVEEIDENGVAAWHSEVGGVRPGLPQWRTRTLLEDPEPSQGFPRFGATVRADLSVPYRLATPLIPAWPYLSVVRGYPHWGDDRPIFFDPSDHQMVMHWVGFQTAGIISFNSLCYPPVVCFESPFAWYSFDPASERYANVTVRGDNWPLGVPFGPAGPEYQRTTLRMTWTDENYQLWRYSLTVTGDHPLDERIEIGDETVIDSISYGRLLPWIAGRPWRAVTFVEATQGEHGSEGIYDYSVEDNFAVSEWVNGMHGQPPTTGFASPEVKPRPADGKPEPNEPVVSFRAPYLRYPGVHPNRLYEGFRGEYSLVYNRTPELYLSPIDNRVHLRYAEGGLWNLNNNVTLRTHNLDGGPLINGWTRERLPPLPASAPSGIRLGTPGAVEEALYFLDGVMLYAGPGGAALRMAADLVPTTPAPLPQDGAHWRAFLAAQAPTASARDPWNMRSWLDASAGALFEAPGAAIRDPRPTATGFRFVLDLRRADLARAQGAELLGSELLQPGLFLVIYERASGRFQLSVLTPPELRLEASGPDLLLEPAVEVRPNLVELRVDNQGGADAIDTRLSVSAVYADGEAISVGTRTLTVNTGEAALVRLPWTPPRAGDWTLRASVTYRPPDAVAAPVRADFQQSVAVAPVALPSIGQSLSGFGLVPPPALLVFLAAVIVLAAASLWYLLGASSPDEGPDPQHGD